MSDDLSHPVFAAIYDPVTWAIERTMLRPHREYLVRDLEGRVLDLGAGTGASFPYVAAALASSSANGRAIDLHAVEPDPHMRTRAEDRADELDLAIDIRSARAEALPYEDDSFDVVIASMVFCTIEDVDGALAEVARVLTPGGEFRVLAHVAAEGPLGRLQAGVEPLWRRVAGGCRVTRRTQETFVAAEGFEVIELERVRTGVPPVRPFVRGRLRRRRG